MKYRKTSAQRMPLGDQTDLCVARHHGHEYMPMPRGSRERRVGLDPMVQLTDTVPVNGADSNKVVWRVQALRLQDDAE